MIGSRTGATPSATRLVGSCLVAHRRTYAWTR